MAKQKKQEKSLFGNLLQNDKMFQASTIVEDLSSIVPQRKPFLCTSPSISWSSAVGYYFGTMELLFGPKSSGKTMLALDRIKMMQAIDPEGIVAFVDAELDFEFDSTVRWMMANGVDVSRVLIIREVNIKKVFETHILQNVQKEVQAGNVKLLGIVFDSIAAMGVQLMPTTEAGLTQKALAKLTKQDHGARANYIARIFPFYREFVRNHRPFSCFINQARFKGVDYFGNPIYDTNGGEALFHEMQYRYLVVHDSTESKDSIITKSNTQDMNGKEIQIGHRIKWFCQKNKMGEGLGREGCCDIVYMKGIVNTEREIVKLASKLGIIEQGGAWFSYDGMKWQGEEKAAAYLKENHDVYQDIMAKVMVDARDTDKYEYN